MAAILSLWAQSAPVRAQSDTPPPQGTSRGENFSAKPAPQLFATDCTGGGCHKGPQGLGKNQSQSSLASFLREHYTNSRQSASALADYLLRSPGAPAEARTSRTPAAAQSSRAAARPDEATPAAAPARRAAEPNEGRASARGQRGRQTTAAHPAPPPPAEPAPVPAAAPPPPPPPQFDIFD